MVPPAPSERVAGACRIPQTHRAGDGVITAHKKIAGDLFFSAPSSEGGDSARTLALQTIYEETKGEAIITTGVGQHQMWAAQWYKFDSPRRWVTSGGLGSMGFGLPSALGAAVAHDGTDGRTKKVGRARARVRVRGM